MLTNELTTNRARTGASPSPATQTVMIVNGQANVLELLETVLEAGHYDVVFVESNEHAYSNIRRVQPNLVILCLLPDDRPGCQVLSMLKLDEETRNIPVLTYTSDGVDPDESEDAPESSDNEIFARPSALQMN